MGVSWWRRTVLDRGLSENKHKGLPKKPDGTTDWDIVFDDPDVGLIALIGRVTSADALQQCGLLMIKRLFTRKNDELDVARFTNELNKTISFAGAVGDLDEIKAEVIVMLQRIKAIRVAKARSYLEEKAKNKDSNRRSSGSTAENTYKFINNPKLTLFALIGVVFMAALVIGSAYWYMVANAPVDLAAVRDKEAAERGREAQKAADELVSKRETEREELKEKKALEAKQKDQRIMPPAIVFPGVYVHQKANGKSRSPRPIMPIFVLTDKEMLPQLCSIRPKIIDIINISLNKNLASGVKKNAAHYAKVAESVRLQVNSSLGSNAALKVLLVSNGKLSDMGTAGDRCTFASDRYFDYIYPPNTR